MSNTILVTGGTGFLGRELGLQLRQKYRVILGGRNHQQNHYAGEMTECETIPLDVTNINSLREIVATYKPHTIIHAAATKYVHLSEVYPGECVDVNILGSLNVARVAMESGVRDVIGISTDKATPPTKTMYGISKSAMEKLFILQNGKAATRFMCVRFGNIAWSTGSVFPIWKGMLDKSGHILSTGAHMRRYIFSVTEAAQLVVTALENMERTAGKILSRKMKAAYMEDVLKLFVSRHGGTYEKIAPRKGESVDEIMIGEVELPHTTIVTLNGMEHYLIDYSRESSHALTEVVDTKTAERLSEREILALLKERP